MAMKTVSTLLQLLALSACFATHFHTTGEFQMPGVRRAIQTMAGTDARDSSAEGLDMVMVEGAVDL
jgi:hypothetical protein